MKSTALLVIALSLALPCLALAQTTSPETSPSTRAAESAPALTAPGAAPSTQPSSDSRKGFISAWQAPLLTLSGIGILVLAVWSIRRILHPDKLLMHDAPNRPNSLTPLHLLAAMLVYALAGSAVKAYHEYVLDVAEPGSIVKLLSVAGVQVLMILTALGLGAIGFRFGLRNGMGLNLRHWMMDLGRAILGLLAVMPVVMGLSMLMDYLVPAEHKKTNEMLTILKDLPLAWRYVVIFSAVVLAPVWEELFFRGLLQSMLRRYLGGPWLAILVASIVFAALHVSFTPEGKIAFQDVLPLLALSLALGYNYERCGRLLPSILIHSLFNALMIITFMGGDGLFS